MIEKEFIPYQQALELKELGFDEPCIMQWTYAPELIFCTSAWGHPKLKTNKESYSDSGGDCISAPTYSAAFRWFREKYGYLVSPFQNENNLFFFEIGKLNTLKTEHYSKDWETYEDAEISCLVKLIEIVKNETHKN